MLGRLTLRAHTVPNSVTRSTALPKVSSSLPYNLMCSRFSIINLVQEVMPSQCQKRTSRCQPLRRERDLRGLVKIDPVHEEMDNQAFFGTWMAYCFKYS